MYFYDDTKQTTYFLSKADMRITLVAIFKGKKNERDSYVVNFFQGKRLLLLLFLLLLFVVFVVVFVVVFCFLLLLLFFVVCFVVVIVCCCCCYCLLLLLLLLLLFVVCCCWCCCCCCCYLIIRSFTSFLSFRCNKWFAKYKHSKHSYQSHVIDAFQFGTLTTVQVLLTCSVSTAGCRRLFPVVVRHVPSSMFCFQRTCACFGIIYEKILNKDSVGKLVFVA